MTDIRMLLGHRSRRRLRDTIDREGFAFVPRLLPAYSTIDIVNHLGSVQVLPDDIGLTSLRPLAMSESEPNRYSGNFGVGEYPLHTDMAHWFIPPRYMVLRCIRGTDAVATRVASIATAVITQPEWVVRDALFRPRRPLRGRLALLRFRDGSYAHTIYRWDSIFLVPDNKEAVMVTQAMSSIDERSVVEVVLRNEGDTLVLDNWAVVHGRSAVPAEASARLVDRAYVTLSPP